MKDYKDFKRQYRDVSPETREKISTAMTGRHHSDETKNRISNGLKKAWAKIPYKTQDSAASAA